MWEEAGPHQKGKMKRNRKSGTNKAQNLTEMYLNTSVTTDNINQCKQTELSDENRRPGWVTPNSEWCAVERDTPNKAGESNHGKEHSRQAD